MTASARTRAKARESCQRARELHRTELRKYAIPRTQRHECFVAIANFSQRAFRQRKEGYIKKLEEQVKEFQTMEQNFRALQNENYQLREYILNLQSRLLENQSDFPPAPSHINLRSGSHPGSSGAADSSSAVEQQLRREMQDQGRPQVADPLRHDAMRQLQAAAAQASEAHRMQEPPYGLGTDYPGKRPRTEEGGPGVSDAKPST